MQCNLDKILENIGPQSPNETGLAARTRFHQSWFRFHILGLDRYGRTASHLKSRPLGSILTPEDAANGLNFASPEARSLFEKRRTQGWGVDPVRCTSHLTSSQALTLNVFGPLFNSHLWLQRLMGGLLETKVTDVLGADIEYAPSHPSRYLGDKTRIDAWVRLSTEFGPSAVVFELKYADRFNSRYINPRTQPQYRALSARVDLWDFDDPKTESRTVNQLIRCHALGAAVWVQDHPNSTPPRLVVIHHTEDTKSHEPISKYREILQKPELLTSISLNHFFELMAESAHSIHQSNITEKLATRYISHDLSQELWERHLKIKHKIE